MWRVLFAVLVVVPGLAAAGPPKDLIPFGDTWFCTQVTGITVCFRDEGECNGRSEGEDCRQQVKASVVTYFDVMNDRWAQIAFASTPNCNTFRKVMAKNPDVKSMSGCQLVGERMPPPAKLAAAAIPGGPAWFCTPTGLCLRDESACSASLEDGEKSCKKQARASLYTRTSALEGAPAAFAFATAKQCDADRRKHVFAYDDVSSCTTIGATAGPPQPKGWFCYEGTKEAGHCLRTKEDCDARRAYDVRRDLAPRDCAAKETAFAFVNLGELEGYPNAKDCDTALASAKLNVRCKEVR